MCGRFTLTVEISDLQQEFALSEVPAVWRPRYNIAPSQTVAVITDFEQPKIEWFRWGLVPFWAKDPSIGLRMINARSETVAQKPSFRHSFASQRCLILADGFYEWQRSSIDEEKSKPYFFQLINKWPFAFAGLWEEWHKDEDDEIKSCTIITCPANKVVASIHDRMPVILSREYIWRWLEPRPLSDVQKLLLPYPADKMTKYQVSRMVNNTKMDHVECVQPLEKED